MKGRPLSLRNDLIGVAGVYFVAYRLSLRGLIVLPTMRNAAGIDLLVNDPKMGALASIQVKASMEKVTYWPMPQPEKCSRAPNTFYVFLRYLAERQEFEGFLASADAVAQQVEENIADYRRRGLSEFAYWELPTSAEETEQLRQAWSDWMPSVA
ncbi:MAG: hypothetical protein ACM359_08590 [Bacillota bacterium]